MNKEQFLEYIWENFTLDGTSQRLITSFVDYVCAQSDDDETKWAILYSVLDSIRGNKTIAILGGNKICMILY